MKRVSENAGLVSFEKKKGVGLNHNICIVDSNKFHFEYNPDARKAEASLLRVSLIVF